MARIYLTYTRPQAHIAAKLRDSLRAAGHQVTVDNLERAQPPGKREAVIRRCSLFLVLLGAEPLTPQARRVSALARKHNRRIIPVTVALPAEIPAEASRRHIDAVSDPDSALTRLHQLARQAETATSPPRRPPSRPGRRAALTAFAALLVMTVALSLLAYGLLAEHGDASRADLLPTLIVLGADDLTDSFTSTAGISNATGRETAAKTDDPAAPAREDTPTEAEETETPTDELDDLTGDEETGTPADTLTPVPGETPDDEALKDYDEPIASFSVQPASGDAPLSVTFSNESLGAISSYEWDFTGDGVVDSTAANPPGFVYHEAGFYHVSLTVYALEGVEPSTVTEVIIVYDGEEDEPETPTPSPTATPDDDALKDYDEPIASIYAEPTFGDAPLTVVFRSDSLGQVTSHAWDFTGDGITDNTAANPPPYTYNEPGEYTVTLKVSGPSGEGWPDTVIIIVYEPESALASPTPTITATATATVTSSATATVTATATPTVTATVTATLTALTLEVTEEIELTEEAEATVEVTEEVTEEAEPPTQTATEATPTSTSTPTETPTATTTPTPTASATERPTDVPEPAASATSTATATTTPSVEPTPEVTEEPSIAADDEPPPDNGAG
jgi:PKD repeat protein